MESSSLVDRSVYPALAVDEAASEVVCVLPEGFAQTHELQIVAAIIDTGWDVEDAALNGDLLDLLPSSRRDRSILVAKAKTVVRPWDALSDALRGALAPATGRVEGRAQETMQTAQAALDGLRAALVDAIDPGDEFDDFSDLADEPLAVTYAPGDLAYRVVYGTGLTTFAGQGDSGKSTIAQAIALDALRAGHVVVHLDYEQGKAESVSKYLQLGSSLGELRGSLIHSWRERDPLDRLVRVHTAHPERPLFVLIDSFSKSASASGIGNVDWAGHGALVSGFNAFGVDVRCPTLMIDHLSGGDSSTEKYASGAAAKFDAASAQYSVSTPKARKFSENRVGEITLNNTKARYGGLEEQVRVTLGGDGPNVIRPRRSADGQAAVIGVERKIVDFLSTADEPLPKSAVEKGVGGNAGVAREALAQLVATGQVTTVREGRWAKFQLAIDSSSIRTSADE